jgi:transcriptional regulator with XRE-family HTH domain
LQDIKIGEKIKRARKNWGLSQMELAERVGISFQQIQKYEKGATRISVTRLCQISKALGVPIADFLKDEKKSFAVSDASRKYSAAKSDPGELLPLNKDEMTLLKLFRKVKNKKLRECAIDLLKSIIAVENIR